VLRLDFLEGAQWFIAGWSSPVARQAHNLKVIGSNPIPATSHQALESASFSRAFCCSKFGWIFRPWKRHEETRSAKSARAGERRQQAVDKAQAAWGKAAWGTRSGPQPLTLSSSRFDPQRTSFA
jgi:hypothetical protein